MDIVPFKPMGRKRALLIAIWCVLGSDLPNLDFAHRDAKQLRDDLIKWGYDPRDIILMIDDKDHPEHLWPTRCRILHQMNQLTHNAPEDCHVFFYFSGHALEEEYSERASMRANGRDNKIVCADGHPILDYMLHDRLITPLERGKGTKLFALLDCCHSETLLDLQRGRGHNRYSRLWTMGRDQLFRGICITLAKFLRLFKKHRRKDASSTPRRKSSFQEGGPESESREVGELSVICLSACRDGQLARDDRKHELTFTKTRWRPNMTWIELRDTLRKLVCEIRRRYEEVTLQDPVYWVQKPMFTMTPHVDLTQAVLSTL